MPYGFGIDSFGNYLGSVDWGKSVLWDSLPQGHRIADVDGLFEGFMRAYADELNYFKEEGEFFAYNKSPFTARNDEVNSTVKLVWNSPLAAGIPPYSPEIVEDPYWGTCVRCKVDSSTDIEELVKVGPTWVFKVKQDNPDYNSLIDNTDDQYATSQYIDITYTVIRVRTRNKTTIEDNEIWIKSKVLPDFTYQPANGYVFYQPSLLPFLARERGIDVNAGDSEFFQRGTVASALEIFSWKTTKKGYRGQGEYSGWEIDTIGLWRVSDCTDVPVGNKWIIDGICYSDANPRIIQFDDIPADTEYIDPDIGSTYLLDNAVWWEDGSADGMNPAMSFSQNVLNAVPMSPLTNTINVKSVVWMTLSECQIAGLAFGYKVTLTMTQAQRDKIGYVAKGVFALRHGTDDYYIEGEESYVGGVTNEWIVYIGTSLGVFPAVGWDMTIPYFPSRMGEIVGCGWCKTSKIRMEITETSGLIGQASDLKQEMQDLVTYLGYRAWPGGTVVHPTPMTAYELVSEIYQERLRNKLFIYIPLHVTLIEMEWIPAP